MQFIDLVEALDAVRATRSRKAKVAALAACLAAAPPDEVGLITCYLSGSLRQRRTGVGWRSVSTLPAGAARSPELSVGAVDQAFESISRLSGSGSQAARTAALADLFGRATEPEQQLLRGLITGEIRTGALEAVLVEAAASAFDIPVATMRRGAMLAGSAPEAVSAAALRGAEGVAAIGLEVNRPVQPMLAGSASDVDAAVEIVGLPCVVDGKLDGIRIQVHKSAAGITIASRSLDDLSDRLPEVTELVASLQVGEVVLDGEALLVDEDGRPRAFQETASRSMLQSPSQVRMTPYFFDVLRLDGDDVWERPLSERSEILARVVPAAYVVPRAVVASAEEARAFNAGMLDAGQEGVVLKALDSTWEAGRRGSGWVKVKPRHTLDLVVLAVEWGSGRRRGMLSNIHLGARDDSSPTGFTMLGKTFKGMTDEILAWQTERFLELETHREGHVVHVRPEQVVEIAFDGVQRSTRYAGGMALRFARVLRYRDDKRAPEADRVETVRSYFSGASRESP